MAIQIQIDFPDAPKVSERPEKQQAFEDWYADFKTLLLRQFEELAAEVDRKQDSP
jgi:hypothetical protein